MSKPEIVEIRLGRNAAGNIDQAAPFIVIAPSGDRSGLYIEEPGVIAQFSPGEDRARFEATWDGIWKFGRRVADG